MRQICDNFSFRLREEGLRYVNAGQKLGGVTAKHKIISSLPLLELDLGFCLGAHAEVDLLEKLRNLELLEEVLLSFDFHSQVVHFRLGLQSQLVVLLFDVRVARRARVCQLF